MEFNYFTFKGRPSSHGNINCSAKTSHSSLSVSLSGNLIPRDKTFQSTPKKSFPSNAERMSVHCLGPQGMDFPIHPFSPTQSVITQYLFQRPFYQRILDNWHMAIDRSNPPPMTVTVMIITNKKKILPEIVISQKRSQFWHWELNYQADSVVIVSLPHSPVANGTDDYIDNMADAGRAVASALCSFDRTDSKKFQPGQLTSSSVPGSSLSFKFQS